MKYKKNEKNIFTFSATLVFFGIVICFIALCIAQFDMSTFAENGEHVWYRTVRLDDSLFIGIGE